MKRFTMLALLGLTITSAACNVESDERDAESDVEATGNEEETATTEQAILGSDACRNVEITVINGRADGVTIEVDRVEYYSASEAKWYTQSLGDEIIFENDSFTWTNKDLQHAENDLITKWKVKFRRDTGSSWSSWTEQEINTPDDVCLADDNYTLTVT